MPETFAPINLQKLGENTGRSERPEIPAEIIESGKKAFEQNVDSAILRAILQHVEGISYRGLTVGATVVGDFSSSGFGYRLESASNFKPRQHTQHQWDKLCAENNACTAAILDGVDYIPGIVVVSHHKTKGNEGIDKNHSEEVLHCCNNCRNLFRELLQQKIMSEETRIRFVNDESLVHEDEADTIVRQGLRQDAEEITKIPKLKLLKREITLDNVRNLPYEELSLGEFLAKYPNDEPSQRGITIPPYDLVRDE